MTDHDRQILMAAAAVKAARKLLGIALSDLEAANNAVKEANIKVSQRCHELREREDRLTKIIVGEAVPDEPAPDATRQGREFI